MHVVTMASLIPRNHEANVSQFVCSDSQYSDTLGRVPPKIGELWQRMWELDLERGRQEDEMP